VRYSYKNFLCDIPTRTFCAIFLSVAELQHFFAAPALGKNVDAAVASVGLSPTLTLQCLSFYAA
jgi:hypothetical protein